MIPLEDPFPSSDFDDWAGTYDASISSDRFPFIGYRDVLQRIITLAAAHPGQSILDLGTGTGNLALFFSSLGCELWCTDFSSAMLDIARQKLPAARFFLHDLRVDWPIGLNRSFDRIVSAYVFHHFKLDDKLRILGNLLHHLTPGGLLIIGDISFSDKGALEKVKIAAGDEWEDECYWLAEEAIPAVEKIGFKVEYIQVSVCAGIFCLSNASVPKGWD